MARHELLSPLPGTFYRRPSPEAPPFVQVGQTVAAGAVVGLVEVMKTFNEVQAETGGTVVEILVENEDAVEAGQALLIVEV
jgi:acetyl-CoA carboxylase biotin carboxyl carrier protein